MAATFSAPLAAALALAGSQAAWCSILIAALGANRTLTAKRAALGDAWAGTTFWAAPLAGSATAAGGAITSLGTAGTATTQIAADLATGVAVVRFASADGLQWGQFTLGLAGSPTEAGADLTVRSNPSATAGFGIATGFRILAPQSLPGATPMPVAVAVSAAAPARVRLWDWTSGSAVLAGTLPIDQSIDSLTPLQPELLADLGTVPVSISATDLVWDTFKWGVLRTVIGPEANDETSADNVYEIAVSASPTGRWAQYPALGGFQQASDRTVPAAFKVTVETAAGTVLHTFQNPDGSALNSQTAPTRDVSNPLRPWWNCAQWLVWRSARLKLASNINKWHPGLRPLYADNARDNRNAASFNPSVPLITGRNQENGLHHWYAAPAVGLPEDSNLSSNASDPNLFLTASAAGKQWLGVGYAYHPGSSGLHDIYTGPGGPRWDRAGINSTYALLATNSDYVRPKDAVPIRTMAEHWSRNAFNRAVHFTRDARTFAGIPKAEIFEPGAGWSLGYDTYYGGVPEFVAGGQNRNVRMWPPSRDNGIPWTTFDFTGRRFYNGDLGGDSLHNYNLTHYDSALMMRSAISLVAARHAFDMSTMVTLSDRIGSATNTFGLRSQAWIFGHLTRAWITAANHSLTHSRADLEGMFERELTNIFDTIYTQAITQNNASAFYECIRNLGFPMWDPPSNGPGGSSYPFSENSTLWAYITIPIMHMRVSGLWGVMRGKSSKCATVLDWIASLLDRFCCTSVVATQGRFMDAPDQYEFFTRSGLLGPRVASPAIPASWAALAASAPPVGLETMVRDETGGLRERSGTMHLFAQWAYMRRAFFPEVANPDIDAACVLWDGWYAEWRGAARGFSFGIPGNGPMKDAA